FFCGVSLGSDFLCFGAAGTASANVDEGDAFSAMLAGARHRSFAQQRARRAGSALYSQIGFHTHAQVWDRAQIAALAKLQISAAEIGPSTGGTRFCALFHLFPLVRDCARAVSLSALPPHVPRRLPLCLSLCFRESLASNH